MRRIKMKVIYNVPGYKPFYTGVIYSEDQMPEGCLDRFVQLGKGDLIPEPKVEVEKKMDAPIENKALIVPENKKVEEEEPTRKKRSKSKRKRLING